MESINWWCEIYGRQHGTVFFFNNEDANSFLDYMQIRLEDRFDMYFKGFAEGLQGKFKIRYRYMKEPEEHHDTQD